MLSQHKPHFAQLELKSKSAFRIRYQILAVFLGDHFLASAARVRVTAARQIQAGASRGSAVHIAYVGVFAILDRRDSVNGRKMQCDLWKKKSSWIKWP